MRRVLCSPEIAAALRAKLDEGFRIRAKGSREGWPIPMLPRPVLYTDLDGYAIKPHPDTRRKVLTMQIYLPADDSQRELGTAIYKVSPMGVFAWKSYGLAKEKTFPFLPNTGYAFVVIHPAFSLLGRAGTGARRSGARRKAAPLDPQHLLSRAAAAGTERAEMRGTVGCALPFSRRGPEGGAAKGRPVEQPLVLHRATEARADAAMARPAGRKA